VSGATGPAIDVNNLKVGDKVQILGTINSSILGVVSFSCEGVVQIDTDRTFVCDSGNIVSPTSPAPSLSDTPSLSGTPTLTSVSSLKMIRGEVHTYQNGTQVYTRIIVLRSITNLQSSLPISFTCP